MRGPGNKRGAADADTFVVDATYLRAEAGAAIRSFVAPLASVYAAATGRSISGWTEARGDRIAVKVSAGRTKRRHRRD